MFCSSCGHQNKEGASFCESCGKPLPAGGTSTGQSPSTVSSPTVSKLSTGHKVGGSGALLAIICFFLPWVLVSCGGQEYSINGWKLAAGGTIGQGMYASQINGKGIFFLVLLAGIIIIALVYMGYKRGTLNFLDGYGLIALGALPLVILLIEMPNLKDQANQQGLYVDYQFGLWAVVIGYIASIIGGALNLKKPK